MLPVCEDEGLAAAADAGRLTVPSLLHFSGEGLCGRLGARASRACKRLAGGTGWAGRA